MALKHEITETFEYRMWLQAQAWTAEDVEKELARLSSVHGWRCIGYVPWGQLANNRTTGYFLLERKA